LTEPAAASARAFELLLRRLAPDRDLAGGEFERLRRTLTLFFDWRGVAAPDECTDVTLDRLARKLAEGVEVGDVFAFARGIARRVLQETGRARRLERLDEGKDLAAAEPSEDARELPDCLDRCLEELDPSGRELLLGYYVDRGRRKIEARQELAASLGLGANALRSRMQRLRDRVEACVRRCLRHVPEATITRG
jgi:DNA-directed RNA polymerase specialized sigma24 family protein